MTTSYFARRILPYTSLLCVLGCNLVIGERVETTGGAGAASSGGAGGSGSAAGTGGSAAFGGAGGSGNGSSGGTGAAAGTGNANTGGSAGGGGAQPSGPVPNIFYTDITHAPVAGGPNQGGALVTLFGRDFGSSVGSVELGGQPLTVLSWGQEANRGLSKVVVQLPAGTSTGVANLQLISAGLQRSNTTPLVTTNKKIWYASPSGGGDGKSLAAPLALSDLGDVYAAGDLVYLLEGEYDYATPNCFEAYGCSWRLQLSSVASQNEPVQIMGYPDANARFVGQKLGVYVDQDHARIGNLTARVNDDAGAAVFITSRQVAVVNCDLNAVGGKTTSTVGVILNGLGADVELTGNYFHDLFSGTEAFTEKPRTERFNEYRNVSRIVIIDPAAPLLHYGNEASDVWQYALIGSGGATPAQIELFDNVVHEASYFVYQTAGEATGEILLRNNSVDSHCLVGADGDGLTLPVRFEANAFALTDRWSCHEPVPSTANLTFAAAGNYWGAVGAPAEDTTPALGDAALGQDLTPGAGSVLCGAAAKPGSPYDVDFLRTQRRSPTAIGAFECQE